MDGSIERMTMTLKEAAVELQVSRPTIYKMANSGLLPVIRIGHLFRVSRVQLERMINEKQDPPTEIIKKDGMK